LGTPYLKNSWTSVEKIWDSLVESSLTSLKLQAIIW